MADATMMRVEGDPTSATVPTAPEEEAEDDDNNNDEDDVDAAVEPPRSPVDDR